MLKVQIAHMKEEINGIWVEAARICRGDRAADKLERELRLS